MSLARPFFFCRYKARSSVGGSRICRATRSLFYGEKAGQNFFWFPAQRHAPPAPSIPAALWPARHNALIFGWLLYTTAGPHRSATPVVQNILAAGKGEGPPNTHLGTATGPGAGGIWPSGSGRTAQAAAPKGPPRNSPPFLRRKDPKATLLYTSKKNKKKCLFGNTAKRSSMPKTEESSCVATRRTHSPATYVKSPCLLICNM